MLENIALQLFLSALLGGVIGLEREQLSDERTHSENLSDAAMGVRSFFLTGLFGGLLGVMGQYAQSLMLMGVFGFIVVLFVHYQVQSSRNFNVGMTTATVALLTLFIGIFLTFVPLNPKLMIALTVVVAFILAQKQNIKKLLQRVYGFETNALINFMLLAFVVLPFIPSVSLKFYNLPYVYIFFQNATGILQKIGNIEILNPAKIWNLLVLVVGIDFLGYLLKRTLGNKHGVILQALAGGIASSTATTVALANESKHQHSHPRSLIGPVLLANAISYLPLLVLISAFNTSFFTVVYPYLFLTIFLGVFLALIAMSKNKYTSHDHIETIVNTKIFSLLPAIKFLGIFVGVKIMLQVFNIFFGQNGVILGIIIGALTGMDAVTVSIAELAGNGLEYDNAIFVFLLASIVNLLGFKSFYVWTKGERQFAKTTIFNLAVLCVSVMLIYLLV